jgi:hypothetical protein
MKLRIAVAALLAGLAGAAFGHEITIDSDQSCPKGTYQLSPAYSFDDGRFVQTGKVCKDLLSGD